MVPKQPKLDVQISVEDGDWPEEATLQLLATDVLDHCADFLATDRSQPFPAMPVEVSLVFTDDASIRQINAEWRKIDKPTNVLSFPAYPLVPGAKPGPMLGDIIFARETLEREAVDQGLTFDAHLKHLLVHGFLHLFGYDHIVDEDATVMEGLETRILAGLGVSDPYGHEDPIK